MSGLITFQHGPFKGWQLELHDRWADRQPVHATVRLTSPAGRTGLLGFRPGIDGWDHTVAAILHTSPTAMAELLEWIVEATAAVLDRAADLAASDREFWSAVVAEADDTRAEFFARYPGGVRPAFETVATLAYDGRTDRLVAA